MSYIFLTDSFVYKVKKGVDFGFLNFTTVDRRRFYCGEEVRLNRRLCPDIYLGVVELRETASGVRFGEAGANGGGRVLDYAVKMKRLPEQRMLSHLVERGEVSARQMEQIARFIAEFHGKAERGRQIDAFGSAASIRAVWEENLRQVAPFQGDTIAARDLALIRNWVERFMSEHAALFAGRVSGGFIRDCDGDLHLDNICLTDRICIFDCIEFNDKFRYIDTASDIAFLLMDLEYAGRPDLCDPFLATYQAATGDGGLAEFLDFYKCHRAFIRGKVKSLRLKEHGIACEEAAEVKATAQRYFRLARGYTLRDRLPPSLILTCGLMGSGKSALARELSFQLGVAVERSDQVRKALPAAAAQPAEGGYDGGIYSAQYNEIVYRALMQRAREALASGRSLIVDATFRRRGDRELFRQLARELGVPFHLLETRCSEELIRERLEKRRLDPTEISDGRWEIFHRHRSEFEPTAPGESIPVDSALPLPDEADRALSGMGLLP